MDVEENNKYKWQKHCLIPECLNTSVNSPDKLFIRVPKNLARATKWFNAILAVSHGIPPFKLPLRTTKFCCEDHFDLENDAENWFKIKLMGCKRVTLKKNVVPHIFDCQTDFISSETLQLYDEMISNYKISANIADFPKNIPNSLNANSNQQTHEQLQNTLSYEPSIQILPYPQIKNIDTTFKDNLHETITYTPITEITPSSQVNMNTVIKEENESSVPDLLNLETVIIKSEIIDEELKENLTISQEHQSNSKLVLGLEKDMLKIETQILDNSQTNVTNFQCLSGEQIVQKLSNSERNTHPNTNQENEFINSLHTEIIIKSEDEYSHDTDTLSTLEISNCINQNTTIYDENLYEREIKFKNKVDEQEKTSNKQISNTNNYVNSTSQESTLDVMNIKTFPIKRKIQEPATASISCKSSESKTPIPPKIKKIQTELPLIKLTTPLQITNISENDKTIVKLGSEILPYEINENGHEQLKENTSIINETITENNLSNIPREVVETQLDLTQNKINRTELSNPKKLFVTNPPNKKTSNSQIIANTTSGNELLQSALKRAVLKINQTEKKTQLISVLKLPSKQPTNLLHTQAKHTPSILKKALLGKNDSPDTNRKKRKNNYAEYFKNSPQTQQTPELNQNLSNSTPSKDSDENLNDMENIQDYVMDIDKHFYNECKKFREHLNTKFKAYVQPRRTKPNKFEFVDVNEPLEPEYQKKEIFDDTNNEVCFFVNVKDIVPFTQNEIYQLDNSTEDSSTFKPPPQHSQTSNRRVINILRKSKRYKKRLHSVQ